MLCWIYLGGGNLRIYTVVRLIGGGKCLFNDVGGIKGKLMDVDAQWVKIETPKKGTQIINRNMIRSVNFENK